MNVLLAVDGSDYTKRMLAYLAAHDELLGKRASYTAVTVVGIIPARAARFLNADIVDEYYRDEAEAILRPVQSFAEMNGWQMRTLQAHGPVAQTIADIARKEKPDLVVMGSHGHSTLGNLVLGSVATAVMAACDVPVLLVR